LIAPRPDGNDRIEGRGGADTFIGGVGADTLLARDGIAERVDCGAQTDAGEADTIDDTIACEGVARSADRVPDGDRDGSSKPADCDNGNLAIRPGAADVPDNAIDEDCSGADAVNLDRDADGVLRPADCADGDRANHPRATDIPGNAVDEDCAGGPPPFPLLDTQILSSFDAHARTVVLATSLRHVHKVSTLRISCRGAGCPFGIRKRKLGRNREKLAIPLPLGAAKLKPGARYEVRVTSEGRWARSRSTECAPA
jgi:hypothetical protein